MLWFFQNTTWLIAFSMCSTSHWRLPLSIFPEKLSPWPWHLHIFTRMSLLNTLTAFRVVLLFLCFLSTLDSCEGQLELLVNLAEISCSWGFYQYFALFRWTVFISFDNDKASKVFMIIWLTPVDIILILSLAFRYKFALFCSWTFIIIQHQFRRGAECWGGVLEVISG
jgi:hypothetical protein